MVARVDSHGCRQAVEARAQGRAGQLDRERLVAANGAVRAAEGPALVVAEFAAGGDVGGEVDGGGVGPVAWLGAQGEPDGGWFVGAAEVAALPVADNDELLDA